MVRPSKRFLLIGISVGVAEAGLGVPLAGSLIGTYLWVCGGTTVLMAIVTHRLLTPPGDDGGRGPRPDEPPPPDEPPWWPEFESEFRAHVQERLRDERPV